MYVVTSDYKTFSESCQRSAHAACCIHGKMEHTEQMYSRKEGKLSKQIKFKYIFKSLFVDSTPTLPHTHASTHAYLQFIPVTMILFPEI